MLVRFGGSQASLRLARTGEGARPHMIRGGFRVSPDAGETGYAFRGDGKVGAGADQDFFQAADELDRAYVFALGGRGVRRSRSVAAQVEDGIADDLSWSVESNVSAAVAVEELDAALGKEFARGHYVGGFRIAA